jgi:TonB-linked SusC/RagA family outer membrane protein
MKNNTFKTGMPNFWYPPKLLLIMKLIIVIMTTFLIQASASSFAQRITLNEKATSLQKILSKIRMQTGYDFISNNDLIRNSRSYSIQVNNVSLEEALNVLFANQDLTFLIEDKTVVIKQKASSFLNRILKTITADDVRGRVLDEKGTPLPNAIIRVKGTTITYSSDSNGEFSIKNINSESIIQISYLGYRVQEIPVSKFKGILIVQLTPENKELQEVNIISTGFQKLSKERATGSFEFINKELFNRSSGTNVLERLDGIVTGLSTFKNTETSPQGDPTRKIQIRGLSSLSNTVPLVILDNFPYDGDVRNINPNDVESITILKDAAAASIWGTRSGNGVVVITTKKGEYEKSVNISVQSNLTIAEKPDLFYLNKMSSSDYIDVEKFLFDQGFYNRLFRPSSEFYFTKSPVVELLNKKKNDPSNPIYNQQIDALRGIDSRNDFMKYVYRKAVNQQYSMNINGGSKQIAYMLSGGYDKNLNSLVTSGFDRISLRAGTTIKPVKNIELQSTIQYVESKFKDIFSTDVGDIAYDKMGLGKKNWPYLRLADDQGNPLPVDAVGYGSRTFRETATNKGLLQDWLYRPLAELDQSSRIVKRQDVLVNFGVNYKITPIVNASIKYQYERVNGDIINTQKLGSYYVRDYINYFTTYNNNNIINQPVPVGGINQTTNSTLNSQSVRAQIDVNKTWNGLHELNAIAGAEIRSNHDLSNSQAPVYGFDENRQTFKVIDPITRFPILNGFDVDRISYPMSFSDRTDRNTSYFANAAYSYSARYTITLSARKDAANIFWVASNRRGQPLWSAGTSWNISNEPFYKFSFLPNLKLRVTYGYQGNSTNAISAYPTIIYASSPNPYNQQNYAEVQNPPNPSLRWERVSTLNLGFDFGTKNNRLAGNIEYYDRHSKDLIAPTNIDPTTGFLALTVNSANLHGKGVDITLNSINLKGNHWAWTSNLLFNYNLVKTDRYLAPVQPAYSYVTPGLLSTNPIPVEGRNAFGFYTYKWGGLDPENGDPTGFINGVKSKDYTALAQTLNMDDLEYHRSSVPLYFGSFRNTFSWKTFSVSFNLQYKFKYEFMSPGSLSYAALYQGFGSGEYKDRWQKSGDEKFTNVPSMVYPANPFRDLFYQGSSAQVEKGDHIRLQDIIFNYSVGKIGKNFNTLRVYANMSNLGIIWRANKKGIDPDYGLESTPAPKTLSVGFSMNFK